MKIMVFDTETISVNKKFCYNVGYVITDSEYMLTPIVEKDFVVEQIWHNKPLFETAYYANKRDIYVRRMRGKTAKMMKFGRICQEMIRDIEKYDVQAAYAYNSSFDEQVFNFNCDWYKCNNPFDTLPIYDIRGFVHNSLIDENFKQFCEEHQRFTDSGNYSTTAETIYQYLSNKPEFEEEHTALSDSRIELEILFASWSEGYLDLLTEYPVKRSIPRNTKKWLTVRYNGTEHTFVCNGYTVYKSKDLIVTK